MRVDKRYDLFRFSSVNLEEATDPSLNVDAYFLIAMSVGPLDRNTNALHCDTRSSECRYKWLYCCKCLHKIWQRRAGLGFGRGSLVIPRIRICADLITVQTSSGSLWCAACGASPTVSIDQDRASLSLSQVISSHHPGLHHFAAV